MLVPIYHLTVIFTNVFALSYLTANIDIGRVLLKNKESNLYLPFDIHYMFFTVWALLIVTTYHAVAFLNHFIGNNENYFLRKKDIPFIRYTKDSIFSVAFALTVFVTVAYWLLRTINRDFVDPEELALPLWLNHLLHTFSTLTMVREFFFAHRGAQVLGHHLVVAVSVAYASMTMYYMLWHNVYFYPIMEMLPFPCDVTFLLVSVTMIYVGHLKVEEYDRKTSICNADFRKDK